MRKRTCDNPAPANGGRDCREQNMQTQSFNSNDCPGKFVSYIYFTNALVQSTALPDLNLVAKRNISRM